MLIQQQRQPNMLSHRVSLTPACIGTDLSLCDSCVYPCVCCPWDSLSPASRRTWRLCICPALGQPLLAMLLGSLHPATYDGFKSSAFQETSLLSTSSFSRVYWPLDIGWWRPCSSGARRTTVWRSSPPSPWAPFRWLSMMTLFARFPRPGGCWPISSAFSALFASSSSFTCFLAGTLSHSGRVLSWSPRSPICGSPNSSLLHRSIRSFASRYSKR